MIIRLKKSIIFLLLLLAAISLPAEPLKVYIFEQTGCPNCHAMNEFLASMQNQLPDLEITHLNIAEDPEAADLFVRTVEQLNISSAAVPLVLVGQYYWVGAREQVREEIAHRLSEYQVRPYTDLVGELLDGTITDAAEITTPPADLIRLPLLEEIRLGALPLAFSTALIAFVDGFNPCSLWVLSLVLGMALHARKRLHVLAVGLIFLTVTALVYGGFIFGAVRVVGVLSFSRFFRITLILFTAFFAAVNIKDYLAWKKGVSFTISAGQREGFLNALRRRLNPSRGIVPLLAGTVVLAVSAALIELPCTAGFPVLWAQILARAAVTPVQFWSLLTLYLLVYLLDEIGILLIVVFTLKRRTVTETQGRNLKLAGGALMAAVSLHLIFMPQLIESFTGLLSVSGVTAMIVIILVLVHRHSARD